MNRPAEAETAYRRSLEQARASDPKNSWWQLAVISSHARLAVIHSLAGQIEAATADDRQAESELDRMVAETRRPHFGPSLSAISRNSVLAGRPWPAPGG